MPLEVLFEAGDAMAADPDTRRAAIGHVLDDDATGSPSRAEPHVRLPEATRSAGATTSRTCFLLHDCPLAEQGYMVAA
ncbi:hypothetical protein [Nocardioides sp. URHA0032]|uniref:hypothetical protein n=1 Tax=Nocardioides sp. URHA0032 TaxID=1380388 RepID=UPI000490D253|nr:hypothetical protein [Nocardioides sp. URHA0032]